MRYPLRALLIVAVLGSVVAGLLIVRFVVFEVKEEMQTVRDAYCVDWVEAAISRHLDDNGNRFPTDWQELQKAFEKVTDHSFSFEEVQSRVSVNFAVNTSEANPRFLWLKSGRDVSWGSPPPNERIRLRIAKGPS